MAWIKILPWDLTVGGYLEGLGNPTWNYGISHLKMNIFGWNIGCVKEPADISLPLPFHKGLFLVIVASQSLSGGCSHGIKQWSVFSQHPTRKLCANNFAFAFFSPLLYDPSFLLLPWDCSTLNASAWRTCRRLYFLVILLYDCLLYYRHYSDMKWKN